MEAVPPKALESLDQSAVVRLEPIGVRERPGTRELGQHLALARRVDVELVEEGGDRIVVAGEEPETLERVVERSRRCGREPAGHATSRTSVAIVCRCYPSRR